VRGVAFFTSHSHRPGNRLHRNSARARRIFVLSAKSTETTAAATRNQQLGDPDQRISARRAVRTPSTDDSVRWVHSQDWDPRDEVIPLVDYPRIGHCSVRHVWSPEYRRRSETGAFTGQIGRQRCIRTDHSRYLNRIGASTNTVMLTHSANYYTCSCGVYAGKKAAEILIVRFRSVVLPNTASNVVMDWMISMNPNIRLTLTIPGAPRR